MTHWTVVSRPGPVERAILASLAPAIRTRRHVGSGVTLRVLEGRGAEGDGGSTLIFLHGRGHAATSWAPILAELVRRHRVVALDLPGFGHSASRPWQGGTAREGLAFFAKPIGRAIAELGGASPILVGHSLGGAVALGATLAGDVVPGGLVLVGSMGLGTQVRPTARLYYATDPERTARLREPVRVALDRLRGRAPTEAEALRRELLGVRGGRPDAAAAFRAMCPIFGDPLAFSGAELASIAARTMLVWGDRDEAFPLEVAVEASRVLPHADLRVLAAGHSPHVERPEDVARIVDDFARSLGAARSA